MLQKRSNFFAIIAFIFFLFAGIYITFPLLFHLGDFATGLGDELLIAWIQSWVIHALFANPLMIFNANILYPYPHTLAYSDVFLTASLLSFLPTYIIGQPIAANNFTLISSLVLLGFSLYLLVFYLTKDFFASMLSGILVIFSPATLSFSVHLQILGIEWVPLSILCFLIFIDSQKTRFLLLSLFFFLLQAYNSFLPLYFILFSWLIILLFTWFHNRKRTKVFFSKKHIFFVLITFLLIVPIAIPYFQVSQEFHYVRDIRDSIHFAIQPEDMLYSSDISKLASFLNSLPFNQNSQNDEFKPGYLGLVFTLLVLFSLYYLSKNRKGNTTIFIFAAIACLGFILSLGPLLHLGRHTIHKPFPVPLPYYLFYYILPGFEGFRNSARWEMLFILSGSVTISLILSQWLKVISPGKRMLVYLVLLIGIIGECNFPIKFFPIPQKKDFPSVYSWMNTTSVDSAFIELPIYNWNDTPYVSAEMLREYYGTENFRKIVNGYSGFSPPPWQQMIGFMHTNFPNDKSLNELRKMRVQYIIIDEASFDVGYKAKFEKFDSNTIVQDLKKNPSVRLVKSFDTYAIFAIDAKK